MVVGEADVQHIAPLPAGVGSTLRGPTRAPNKQVSGRPERSADQPQPLDIDADLHNDIGQMVAILRTDMSLTDEKVVLLGVEKWAARPADFDKFLDLLKKRTFRFGEETESVYDALWNRLRMEQLARFKQLVARSTREKTSGPLIGPSEGVASYIGRREAMGLWGMLKGITTTILGGTADALIWATWQQSGARLNDDLKKFGVKPEDLLAEPAYLTPWLEKRFDEARDILVQELGVDADEPFKSLTSPSSPPKSERWVEK